MATVKQKKAAQELEDKFRVYKGSWLYLIKCDEFYKIGIAWDVESRLNSLQCGNPYELELVWAVKAIDAKNAEKLLHEDFKDKRVFREWFVLNDADVERIKKLVD